MKTTCTFLAAPATTSARNVATVSARVVTEKNNIVKWIPAVVAVDPQEAVGSTNLLSLHNKFNSIYGFFPYLVVLDK